MINTITLSKLVKIRCALKTLQQLIEDIIDEECKIKNKEVANE